MRYSYNTQIVGGSWDRSCYSCANVIAGGGGNRTFYSKRSGIFTGHCNHICGYDGYIPGYGTGNYSIQTSTILGGSCNRICDITHASSIQGGCRNCIHNYGYGQCFWSSVINGGYQNKIYDEIGRAHV